MKVTKMRKSSILASASPAQERLPRPKGCRASIFFSFPNDRILVPPTPRLEACTFLDEALGAEGVGLREEAGVLVDVADVGDDDGARLELPLPHLSRGSLSALSWRSFGTCRSRVRRCWML